MKMKKFAALAAATVMSVSAQLLLQHQHSEYLLLLMLALITLLSRILIQTEYIRLIRSLTRHLQQILSSGAKALMAMLCLPA